MSGISVGVGIQSQNFRRGLDQMRSDAEKFRKETNASFSGTRGSNPFAGLFNQRGNAQRAGHEAGHVFSLGMELGLSVGVGGVIHAAEKIMDAVIQVAKMGVEEFTHLLQRGLEFNYSLDQSRAGLAAIIGQFRQLDETASKAAAEEVLKRLIAIEPQTASTLKDLNEGFLATLASSLSAGLSIDDNIKLVQKFANAMSHIGVPSNQLSQELRSILMGNITHDSMLAKVLQITNEDVQKAKDAGRLMEFLTEKIGKLGDVGSTATATFSSLISTIDKALGDATEPLFQELKKGAEEFTKFLQSDEVKTQIKFIADSIANLGRKIAEMSPELKALGLDFLVLTRAAFETANAVAYLYEKLDKLKYVNPFYYLSVGFDKLMNLGAEKETPKEIPASPATKAVLDTRTPAQESEQAVHEREEKLKAIERLEEKIHDMRVAALPDAQRLKALEDDRLKIIAERSALEHQEGLDAKKKALELTEKELELAKEIEAIRKNQATEAKRVSEARESEQEAAQDYLTSRLDTEDKVKAIQEHQQRLLKEANGLEGSDPTEAAKKRTEAIRLQRDIDSLDKDKPKGTIARISVSALQSIGGGDISPGAYTPSVDPSLRESQQQTRLQEQMVTLLETLTGTTVKDTKRGPWD